MTTRPSTRPRLRDLGLRDLGLRDLGQPEPGPTGASSRYRLIVFDFDGTLADSFDWFAGVLDEVAERHRFRRVAAHETERLRGMGADAIVRHLGIPRWRLPAIARHVHRLAARDIAGLRLFPGIASMLAALDARGLPLAVVSSNTEANVRAVLGPEAARIRHFACGAALFGKARRLRAVARAAGVAPARVLAIGDEIRDHDAAREAGCAFAAVAWGYTRPEALAACAPEALFATPEAITAFLERGLARAKTGSATGRASGRELDDLA